MLLVRLLDGLANLALAFGFLLVVLFVLRASAIGASNEIVLGLAVVAILVGAVIAAAADRVRAWFDQGEEP